MKPCLSTIGAASAGGAGYGLPRSPIVSPWSGAKAATYTNPATLGSTPASLITDPAHECPTRRTGPFMSAIARWVAATSSASDVSGFCTAVTLYPLACKIGITLDQLEPSANAPWTSTMFLTGAALATAAQSNIDIET